MASSRPPRGGSESEEAELARRLGHTPYAFSEQEVQEIQASINEDQYCQCRNHILFKWHCDVSTPLSESAACSEILERLKPVAKARRSRALLSLSSQRFCRPPTASSTATAA